MKLLCMDAWLAYAFIDHTHDEASEDVHDEAPLLASSIHAEAWSHYGLQEEADSHDDAHIYEDAQVHDDAPYADAHPDDAYIDHGIALYVPPELKLGSFEHLHQMTTSAWQATMEIMQASGGPPIFHPFRGFIGTPPVRPLDRPTVRPPGRPTARQIARPSDRPTDRPTARPPDRPAVC